MGIYIDENLSWITHIGSVSKKLIRFVGIFYKVRDKIPAALLRTLYFSLVYPHLLYGIEIYGNAFASHLDPLIKLNNKILRIIQGKNRFSQTRNLYIEFGILMIPFLFQFQILQFVYKCQNNKNLLPIIYSNYFTPNQLIHCHDTRTKSDLHRFPIDNSTGAKQIKVKGAMLWNKLPTDIKNSTTLTVFKRKLKLMLLYSEL